MIKHKIDNIEAGHYVYRGYKISKIECKVDRYTAWKIENLGGCYNSAPSLLVARDMIDCTLEH